jgi:cell division protein FtsL
VRTPGSGRSPRGAPIAAVPAAAAAAAAARKVRTAGDRRGVGVGAFLLAIVTAGALTHVAVRLKGLEVAYALGHERRVAADLEEQRRRLQIEIGMLKDPGRVVMIARDKLKMAPPAPEAIRPLGPGRILAAGMASGPGR